MTTRRPLRRLLTLLSLVAVLAAACGGDDDAARETTGQPSDQTSSPRDRESSPSEPASSPGDPTTLRLTADDYSYGGMPAEVPAGAVTIELVNTGGEPHEAQLERLDDGVTADAFLADVEARGITVAASAVSQYGGPSVAAPGATISSTQVLDPGNYVVLCLIPSPDGTPHTDKGMAQAFTVTESDAPPTLPDAPETITANEFDFEVPDGFTGSGDVRFEVTGEQDHAVMMFELAAGKTAQDVLAFVGGQSPPPPPFGRVLGVAAVRPGGAATFEANLEPGTYALLCFIGDPASGKTHVELGMVEEITIP